MFTKGEWKITGGRIKVYGRGEIAYCPSPANGGTIEFIYNVRLISAAPDMYEALTHIIKSYEYHCPEAKEHSNALKRAKQALAKADGT